MDLQTNRRSFLKGSLAAVGGLLVSDSAAEFPPVAGSDPVLQIPAEHSIGVAWAVSRLSTGYVEIGTRPDLRDARRVCCQSSRTGLNDLDDRALSARIVGLAPGTRYYYRTVTVAIDAPNCYSMSVVGAPVVGAIHSFRTPGPTAASAFSVINDTHENAAAFRALSAKLKELDAPVTVWNGDIWYSCETPDHAAEVILKAFGTGYAAERPVLYVPGNHDYRGRYCRELGKVLLTREAVERPSRFAALGRNFAVRQGELALVGLDTGEDKPDANPVWSGLAAFEPYRRLQTEWLKEALDRPEIDSAPYLIVFCHIPLFDADPQANPGDILEGYANWQRPASQMWSPLLKAHRVQLVIAAHQHHYRYDPPTADRPWGQIVGGGPKMLPGHAVTVIHGAVRDGTLRVRVHDVNSGIILGAFTVPPRAV